MKYRTSVSWTQNHHPWTNNRIPITSYSPISYHLHIKKNSLDLHVWLRKLHDWGYLENRVTDCSVFLCATKHSSLPPPPGGHLFNTGLRGQVLDHITLGCGILRPFRAKTSRNLWSSCWKLHNFLLVEKGNYREFTMNVKGNYNEMSHCKEKVATFYESNTSTPQLCFLYYHYPFWSKLLRGKKERACVHKNGEITLKWVSCFSLFTLKLILITFLYT